MNAPLIMILAVFLQTLTVSSFGVVVLPPRLCGAIVYRYRQPQAASHVRPSALFASRDEFQSPPAPLIDLQTFLKLCGLVQTGGEAKAFIQGGECYLNGVIETRRAKKLFPGDTVSFAESTLDVSDEVAHRGYVYKAKKKKVKPQPEVDADGNLEFGGRYRSEEWRAERKKKKAERNKKITRKNSTQGD